MKYIKQCLIAGLLIWLPIGLTIWSVKFVISITEQFVPQEFDLQAFGVHIPGIKFIVAMLILIVTGVITRNIFGQKMLDVWDRLILHIPIVKSIYKSIKQVSDTLLSSKSNAFRHAVLIQFPHHDVWTIAFITNEDNNLMGSEYINVYVPTTPNPTSGYFLMVNRGHTRMLNLSVDEALKYVISIGTINIGSRI